MMKAVINSNGTIREIVETVAGVDLTGCTITDVPQGWPTTVAWVPADRAWQPALQDMRARAWEQIKADRDAAAAAVLATKFGPLQTDASSKARLFEAALPALMLVIARTPTAIAATWTMADNSQVALTAADLLALAGLVWGNTAAIHARAQVLRARIDGAATIAAITAVAWSIAD